MRIKCFLLVFVLSVVSLSAQYNNKVDTDHNQVRNELSDSSKTYPMMTEKDYEGKFQQLRSENFWGPRLSGGTEMPSIKNLVKSVNEFNRPVSSKMNPSLLASTWSAVGPFDEPEGMGDNNKGIGRVNVVRLNPLNESNIWIGTANGGAWESVDAGASWKTFDFTQFLSMGVSDIAISHQNPDVVYIATGDADGVGGNQGYYSIGIIKTTDGGKNWTVTNFSNKLSDGTIVGRMIVDPRNDQNVIVGSSKGISKTTDGGVTWYITQNPNSSEYFKDIEINPANPDILYASTFTYSGGARIYRSSDFGENWKGVYQGSGAIRIALAVTPANPCKCYALVAASNFAFHSFLMSSDTGNTFKPVVTISSLGFNPLGWSTGTKAANDYSSGQGEYDLSVAVSPTDENFILIGGVNIWGSDDGGSNWTLLGHWQGNYGAHYIHADIHDIIFNSDMSKVLVGSDGGISDNSDLSSWNWTSLATGMNITQYYRIDVAGSSNEVIYGGAQDNGSMGYSTSGGWRQVGGGDGMDCAINPSNTNIAFVSSQNGYFQRTTNGKDFGYSISNQITGENGGWTTPIAIDPMNPANVYVGYENVWRSNDNGRNGTYVKLSNFTNNQTLTRIAVSPSNNNYIYACFYYSLYRSTDLGQSWESVYNAGAQITSVTIDPDNPDHFWLTLSGFSAANKILEFKTAKSTPVDLTNNLPPIPVNTMAVDRLPNGKDTVDRIYIGTDIGVFYSDYGSAYWQKFGTGLPNLVVSDLNINPSNRMLYAGTFGRGVWKTNLLECNGTPLKIFLDGDSSLCPGQTTKLSVMGNPANVEWTNGVKGLSTEIGDAGIYSAFTVENGCTVRSNGIRVYRFPLDTIIIAPVENDYICENATLTLGATSGFDKYIWSTGDTTKYIIVNKPGQYSVTGINPSQCTVNSAIFNLIQKPLPPKPTIEQHGNILTSSIAETYKWFRNDTALVGASKQTYQVNILGTYSVRISDANGCSNMSDPFEVTTDVSDLNNDYYGIYPNPSDGIFNLRFFVNYDKNVNIDVFDIFGNKMLSIDNLVPSGNLIIPVDLSDKPAGVYMMRIEINGTLQIRKLIKR